MKTLTGKVALVTGGSRGIGAATAKRLAREGAAVALSYNTSAEAAESVVAAIRAGGGDAEAFQADAALPEAVGALVDAVVERFGRLDILVNNAGVYVTAPIHESNGEVYSQNFDVNVRAVYEAVHHAAPKLSDGGRIVNIGSVVAQRGFPGNSAYGASKAAVAAMGRAWAQELGGRGITVNTVHPGPIDTDMNPADPTKNPMAETLAGTTALKRYGTADEVAKTIAFLVGPASYITGADIPVDGGMKA